MAILEYGERTPLEAASHARHHRKSLAETRRLTGTRGNIATAARKLFERDGVRTTTVTAIAREANVTRELVYYHFGNKNGVIEAVIASTIPKQWNMGTWIISLSAVERSIQSPMFLPLLTTL